MADTDDPPTDDELTGEAHSPADTPENNPPDLGETLQLRLPPDATTDEAAAITSVVAAHLSEQAAAAAAAEPDSDPPWDGDRWRFAGRLASLGGQPVRVTDGVPTDEWTAAGRSDRL